MKKIISILAFAALAFSFASCGKSDSGTDPTPAPTPSAQSYNCRISVKVNINESLREMFDFKGSKLVYGSKEIDLANALETIQSFSEPDLVCDTPCNTSLKLSLTSKDFTPVDGTLYDAVMDISYIVTVTEKNSGETVSTVVKPGGGSFIGIDFKKAREQGKSVSAVLSSLKKALEFDEAFSVSKDGKITNLSK